ncbi:hypothetical protein MKX01_006423 [Papaver californicum]|nr:hypothetical protein MKX01_006423 [Papaver californicum]
MEIGSSYFGLVQSQTWVSCIQLQLSFVKIKPNDGEMYDAVMQRWQLSFNWDWTIQCDQFYEFHKGQWYLVHHHCSVVLITKGSGTWFTIV